MVYAPVSFLENDMHKILWDFEILTDHVILARQRALVIVNKKKKKKKIKKKRICRKVEFAVPADHRVKLKESEKRYKSRDLSRELKKTMKHESDGDTQCNWRARYSHQRIVTGTGRLRNKRTSRDHLNYSIVEIDQNTKKSPGDLRRLVVTHTQVENHQLTLVWKALTWVK